MTHLKAITAFAPATIGNVICGFDVLGLALEAPGDRVTVRLQGERGVRISRIHGVVNDLPTEVERNSAGAAVAALVDAMAPDRGVEVEIEKGLPLSAGMGGSAASAVAAAVAADELLGTRSSQDELLTYALEGERVAAGASHADNVAPSLLGGLVLARPSGRRRIVPLPTPAGLAVALLHPHMELATREARALLGDSVSLSMAVEQLGHVAAFIHALHSHDHDLLADALVDRIAEPHRGPGIPALAEVRRQALASGALACGISGAGPSLFALCRDPASAREAGEAMVEAFGEASDLRSDLHVSPVAGRGARVVEVEPGGASTRDLSNGGSRGASVEPEGEEALG